MNAITHFVRSGGELLLSNRQLEAYTYSELMTVSVFCAVVGASGVIFSFAARAALENRAVILNYAKYNVNKFLYRIGMYEIEAKDKDGRAFLHFAALNGDEKMAAFLLENGANINVPDSTGNTPLHLVAERNNNTMVSFLLEKRANIDAQNNSGETPLHLALMNIRMLVVPIFLRKGARVDAKTFEAVLKKDRIDLQFYIPFLKWVLREYPAYINEGVLKALDSLDPIEKLTRLCSWMNLEPEVGFSDGSSFELYGVPDNFHAASFADLIEDFTQSSAFDHIQLSKEKIDRIQNGLINQYSYDAKEVISNIQAKELIIFPAGWLGHRIYLVFYNGYLAICNRGSGSEKYSTIEVFPIDPELMTDEIFSKIELLSSDADKGKQFFYKILPAMLSKTKKTKQDSLCKSFNIISPNRQKKGTCERSSLLAALRFAWAMLIQDKPSRNDLQRAKLESKLFSNWAATQVFEQSRRVFEKFTGLEELAKPELVKKSDRFQKSLAQIQEFSLADS